MKDLFTSATKIVLITLTLLLFKAVFAENINTEAFELFKTVYVSVISFYFGQKIHTINK
jgi:hypothetical protein